MRGPLSSGDHFHNLVNVVSCVYHVICVHMRSMYMAFVWFLSTWCPEYLRLWFVSFCQSVCVVKCLIKDNSVLISCTSCHDVTVKGVK